MRILYAEDDENDAFFMRRATAKLVPNVKLIVVPNGQGAIDYLEGQGKFADRSTSALPDVLLLDIKMPEVTGHDALRQIREREKFAKLPIIMFTSSSERDDIELSRKTGANAYLVKPADAKKWPDLVQQIIAAVKSWKENPKPAGLLPVWGNLLGG